MIVNKELVVSNRKKVDIIDELRHKKFRPFPKVAKAKAMGETEDVEENDEAEEAASGTSTDYDYLLGMAIWSLTKEKVCVPHQRTTLAHAVAHIFAWTADRETPSAGCGQGKGAASPSRTHSNPDLEH